ncbi:MBL fold metallo-hydrolase [Floccifex sp.]|uniref:MBL fold metallo-hydrolase n=1 Tax=Floccifex sp. TaxID=2815810 RepID=UPI002A75300C|nr:MBL fold metallo-hydrolase [Floccifex sp.]MDD7281384.1 MBL fold metallo-hydrolase [Erysipelotrichaceae bacterium]MDY2958089.1 MBL fold metallo-hydrolase [Floccifex sp.]
MKVITRTLGPVQANCYIIIENNHALIVDPGDSFDIEAIMEQEKCVVDAILLTHAHFDHINGLDKLLKIVSCDVYCNPNEFSFLQDASLNSSSLFMYPITSNAQPKAILEGKQRIGNFEVEAIYCPGHSVGSTVFIIGSLLITGDVLFKGSIGRTDLPTGSYTQMKESINKLKALKLNYHVLPGHGPLSTLDEEKRENPYL